MNEEQRIKLLEEEFKVLKNEVKTILLDIREQYLNIQNPFNLSMVANTAPAGSNPETKSSETEMIAEDISFPAQDEFQAPPPMGTEDISFGKPFTDLSAKDDLPGMGNMDDLTGAGLSGGPEISAGVAPTAGMGQSAEAGPSIGKADAMETPLKGKNSRNRKKKEEEVDFDDDSDTENSEFDDLEDEDQEERPVVRMGSSRTGKKRASGSSVFAEGNRADLVVIAGLTQWVDQSTAKLGKDRTEALVEMSTAMGRIPEKMKDVLIRMVRISRYEANGQVPTATDYLAILAQLESLISGSQVKDTALLSVLSMMKESGRG